jgi:hypothetical protein
VLGIHALFASTTAGNNVASGANALSSDTTGEENVASGGVALLHNTTGSSNVAFGVLAGANLTTGSNNIDISIEGVAGEAGTTRIGTEGKQTRTFVPGVYKKPVKAPACAVKVNSEGQLGCNAEGDSGAVATFASKKEVASGHCLAYTDIGPSGNGACPAKTTGFSTSSELAAMPANGGTVVSAFSHL